ncbi:MAG: hypothetical protein ACK526_01020 [Planctomyces sp.]
MASNTPMMMNKNTWHGIAIPDSLTVTESSERYVKLKPTDRNLKLNTDLQVTCTLSAKRCEVFLFSDARWGLQIPNPDVSTVCAVAKEHSVPRAQWWFTPSSFYATGFEHAGGLKVLQASIQAASGLIQSIQQESLQ